MFFTPSTAFSPSVALKDAACADLPESDKKQFFANGNGHLKAKTICAICTARDECLDRALSFEHPGERRFGVWGGLNAVERDRMCRNDEVQAVREALSA